MLITNLTGLWSKGVQRWIKKQQKHNEKLVKILLTNPASVPPPLETYSSNPRRALPPLATALLPGRQQPAPRASGKWLKCSHPLTMLDSGRPGAVMNYWLYLPARCGAAAPPLVVMLHGCAQTAPQFAQSTRMNELAEREGFAVLYPQQTASNQAGRCWRWYSKEVCEGKAETEAVVAIIDKVVEQYSLDKSRIYIAGISAGAAMANIIALNHPELVAAVGMHSGTVFGAAQTPMDGYNVMQQGADGDVREAVRATAGRMAHLPLMPAILIHGLEDRIVNPLNVAQLAEQFRELHHLAGFDRESMLVKITDKLANERSGNPSKTYEYYFGKRNLLQVCEISELGHAWSGGDESVSFSDSQGPNASRMMWDFFTRHQRHSAASMACPASAEVQADVA